MNHPLRLAMLSFLAVGTCGCPSSHHTQSANPGVANAPVSLNDSKWVLRDLAGVPALAAPEATLEFTGENHVAGSSACNHFTGSVQISGSSLKIGPLASTRMACLNDGVS